MNSSEISSVDKSRLQKYSSQLLSGDSLIVTGYAKGDSTLATSRADAIAVYLRGREQVVVKAVTNMDVNKATVFIPL